MNQEPWSAAWLLDKAWIGAVAFVTFVWKMNDRQLASNREAADKGIASARNAATEALSAHQGQDDKEFKALHDEQQMQRNHIGKIFDQMRQESQLSTQRHIELLTAIHSKADR
jgi:hypothetical protein